MFTEQNSWVTGRAIPNVQQTQHCCGEAVSKTAPRSKTTTVNKRKGKQLLFCVVVVCAPKTSLP